MGRLNLGRARDPCKVRSNGTNLVSSSSGEATETETAYNTSIADGRRLTSGSSSGGSTNPSKAMRMATSLISKEKYAEALAQLETEVAADPKNADAWNLTGFASRKLGDYSRSEKAYDTALAINPKHARALAYKGELYLTLMNLACAEEMLSRLNANCSFNCNELKALR